MPDSLLFPSALLFLLLGLLCVAILAIRRAVQRGMGRRPMSTLPRATYPPQMGSPAAARLTRSYPRTTHPHGAARREIKRSNDPRGAALVHPWPFTSLINRPAAGAAGASHG